MSLQTPEASTRRRLLTVLLLLMLAAGLWPGFAGPENRVQMSGSGLQLEPPSQAISPEPLWAAEGRGSLEVWFEQGEPGVEANLSIVGLWLNGRAQVIFGQWAGGFYIHNHRDNPAGWPELDRYLRSPQKEGVRHAIIRFDPTGIRLSVDGQDLPGKIPLRSSAEDPGFGGRLLLGSSSHESKGFRGRIHGLAFHQHWPEDADAPPPISYGFDGLEFPELVSRPDPDFLRTDVSARWPWSSFLLDLLLNVLGFIPLGMLMAWSRGRRMILRAFFAGLLLSLMIEIVQYWIPGRESSSIDVLCNALGAWLGGWIAVKNRARVASLLSTAGRDSL